MHRLSAETRTLIWSRIYFALPYSWTCGSAYRQDWRASVARWVWGYYRAAFRSAWLSP